MEWSSFRTESVSSSTTERRMRQEISLRRENLVLSTNLLQDRLTTLMSEGIRPPNLPSSFLEEEGQVTSNSQSQSQSHSQSEENRLLSEPPPNSLIMPEFPSRLPNIRSLLTNSSSLDSAGLRQGFAMTSASSATATSTTKAVHAEQRQMFASSRSQTLQGGNGTSMGGIAGLNMADFQFNATASRIQSTHVSSSSLQGVTRSFSSSSGFPPSSSSLFSSQSGDDQPQSSAGDLVSSFVSPVRRAPWNFRNFNRPLWTDMRDNRMTWDPDILQKSSSSNQFQFSAMQMQQTSFFQASASGLNGQLNFRAFKAGQEQRVSASILRQSYGASESESDNDDEDELEYEPPKSITFRQKPRLPYQPKLALMPPPPPSEDGTENEDRLSICPPSEADTEGPSPRDSQVTIEELPTTPEHKKCWKVAHELLTTERTYVRILHLIDQVFHFRVDQENRVSAMFPPEIITQMFCNIKSLYRLHHDHLLPQLEKRLGEEWEEKPRIGDIMKDFAPFLKMYSEYVQNFDNAINLINLYREKSGRFMGIINEIQKMEECANLPIQHHLIGPIQRIPRYRLLLEAYLRRLPEESEDKPDTEKALEIVSKAAEHANEAMRRIASFKKLLEVQENVKGVVDLVSPTRTLVKEGKIFKISARTGDHQERYIFLFSDVILLCSIRPMANRMISPACYQLRAKLDVTSVAVAEGDDLEVMNTFYVEDSLKKIELYTSTPTEKDEWMTAIHNAKEELIQRKSSLRLGSVSPTEEELGLKEPTRLKADGVSKCMECYSGFTMLKRRHHCHACGQVVCAKCSGDKVPLAYCGGKPCRVCKRCKALLDERKRPEEPEPEPRGEGKGEKLCGVLDVPAQVPAVLSGPLSLKSQRGRKEWTGRWFALRSDFVLYCYEGEGDLRAVTATPLPGMGVALAEELSKGEVGAGVTSQERPSVFRLAHGHGRKSFVFLAPSKAEAREWVKTLKLAARAELPTPPGNNNLPKGEGVVGR